jgi:hypothetical protein
MESLGAFLGALGVKLEDESSLEHNRSRLVKPNQSQVRVHRPAA